MPITTSEQKISLFIRLIFAVDSLTICNIKNKKAWNLYPLPVPRIEALALPTQEKRATKNPR